MDNPNKKINPNQIKSITDELYSIPVSKIKYLMSIENEDTIVGIILNWNVEEQVKIAVQNHWYNFNRNKPTLTIQDWKNDTNKSLNDYLNTQGIEKETEERLRAFRNQVNTFFEEKQPDVVTLPEIPKKLSIPDKISLLNELGVISHIKNKYSHLNPSDLARLLEYIIDEKDKSIKPVISSLMSEDDVNKNYPKKTNKVERIINSLL
jgi:hypothetical protein